MRTSTLWRAFFTMTAMSGALLCGAPADDSSIEPQFRGPVLGYVLDAGAQAIRPINGIPGASRLGAPLALPLAVSAAAFSSRSDFALAVAATEDHPLYLVRNLGSAAPALFQIEGAIAGADRLVLNAGNTAALAVSSDLRQLQVIRGLPDQPRAGPAVDLAGIAGKLTALALVSRGNSAVALVGFEGALYRVTFMGDKTPLLEKVASAVLPSAIAFLHDDRDVLVADSAANQLALIRDWFADAESSFLAGERDGISGPVGLQVSQNGRQFFVANQGTRSLDVWDIEARSLVASLPLDAAPNKLVPLDTGPTFLLNDVGDDPLLVLDAADTPAVYFVPAAREQ